jgi:hypothetical protein
MTLCNRHTYLVLILVAASSATASGQDSSWNQPYSGNVVYGPMVTSSGKLPNCPDCQCEICQPCGPKGFIKRLFGGAYDKLCRCRREVYYTKQM